MSGTLVQKSVQNSVAILTMNAPSNLNALSVEMLEVLKVTLSEIGQEPAIRAVILRGNGRAFCAGHDLKQMQAARNTSDKGRKYFADLFRLCSDVMQLIPALRQPVIAEVHGVAVAAGCQLVASCDMAIAAEGTRFGVNGVNIGLFCSTPMVALTRNISRKRAFEMLTTGQLISTEQAAAFGLINRAVPAEDLQSETLRLAETIAAKLSAAVTIGKQTFYNQAELSLSEAYELAGSVMVENMLWRDTDEGINAFLEKRAPDWK